MAAQQHRPTWPMRQCCLDLLYQVVFQKFIRPSASRLPMGSKFPHILNRIQLHRRPILFSSTLTGALVWTPLLLVADYLYFSALRHPNALVAIVMSLRRASTLVAFAGGLYFFHEVNGWKKLPAVIGILVGIVLTLLG
jgi:drug/metabolite transporter (DMT)-like permease